jgi:hypothetical protein
MACCWVILPANCFPYLFSFSHRWTLSRGLKEKPNLKRNNEKIFELPGKSLNIVRKHVFICSNPYIYTTVVQEVYNRDRSPEIDDVEGLAAAATKHLELLKQKDEAEIS